MPREEDVQINVKVNVDEERRRLNALSNIQGPALGAGALAAHNSYTHITNAVRDQLSTGGPVDQLDKRNLRKINIIPEALPFFVSEELRIDEMSRRPQFKISKDRLYRSTTPPTLGQVLEDAKARQSQYYASPVTNVELKRSTLRDPKKGTILNPAIMAGESLRLAGRGIGRGGLYVSGKLKDRLGEALRSPLGAFGAGTIAVNAFRGASAGYRKELERLRAAGESYANVDLSAVGREIITVRTVEGDGPIPSIEVGGAIGEGIVDPATKLARGINEAIYLSLAGITNLVHKSVRALAPRVGASPLQQVALEGGFQGVTNEILTVADLVSGRHQEKMLAHVDAELAAGDEAWNIAVVTASNMLEIGFTHGTKGNMQTRINDEIYYDVHQRILKKMGLKEGSKD